MILNDQLFIRNMNSNDFTLMVRWLNDSMVLEYYEESPLNLEKIKKNMVQELKGLIMLSPAL
ncbi:hypothetical protein [Lysinibacillus xylanilyticus]|uniref:hypothetical protein n=1 Tax=Lysinibacillus xylanilyticus TaxID=582475 RepID=UPI003D97D61B